MFTELTRIKQYFDKIKKIETPQPERENTVDTQAAIRFIRSDLVGVSLGPSTPASCEHVRRYGFLTTFQAGNKELNTKLSEQLAKERAKAVLKASKGALKRSADDAGGPAAESPATGSGSNDQAQKTAPKKPKRQGSKKK